VNLFFTGNINGDAETALVDGIDFYGRIKDRADRLLRKAVPS